MDNKYEDIVEAFGNKLGTFTGYWSVKLHPDRVKHWPTALSDMAKQLEVSIDDLLDAEFCMKELQVARSSSRMTVTMERNYEGPNPFSSELTPEQRKEAEEYMRLKELKATHLNTVMFYYPKEQKYMVSPY